MRTDVNPRFQCGLGNIRIVHNLDFVQIMQRLIINLLSKRFIIKFPQD